MPEQRWLSIDGICSVLETNRTHIAWLVKRGYIEALPGHKKLGARYLDPTASYAELLRTTEVIYGRRHPLPPDISLKAIFTKGEVAQLMGWSDQYASHYLRKNKVPCITVGSKTRGVRLYTALTIREMIHKRSGRVLTQRKFPFLLTELIEFFRKTQTEVEDGIPTDSEFSQDAKLQKKFEQLLKLPVAQRQAAIQELWGKVKLAKEVAGLLK